MIHLLLVFVFGLSTNGPILAAPPNSDELALALLDSEAVYTIGGLKPISDGFWQTRFPADRATSDDVESVRAALRSLPLGPNREAGVYVFHQPFQGKKSASAFVLHRPTLAALINRRGDVFRPLGIQGDLPGQQIMERIDRAERSSRWRAFGLVFGYPEYAVEFFVSAGESEAKTKSFIERDFRAIPTVASDRGRFVYAVPKGHIDRAEDLELAIRAEPIFDHYITNRNRFVGPGLAGPTELLRAMTTEEKAICSCVKNRSRSFCRRRCHSCPEFNCR